MDLNYTPEDLAFRDEVRSWLRDNVPAELRAKVDGYQAFTRDELMRWQRILADKGWAGIAWPQEWGGPGWSATQRHIFEEECGTAGTPPLVSFALAMCGPVLMRFGTQAQKERFLPPMLNAEEFWCQGYSEPGSGSDLASLKTRAVRDGDHYVVNGQKIWTTMAQHADWIFCLVRTDTETRIRQEGISFLLIDMKTPGISVRPLILMDGGHEVNEVFFDDVRVPVENLVHEEGKGWTVAKFLLGHERLNAGRIGVSKRELASLKRLAAKQPDGQGGTMMDDTRFRDRMSRVEIELMALEITNLRFLDKMLRSGQPPGTEVSLLKLRGTEIQQELTELMMQAVGNEAAAFAQYGDAAAGDIDPYTSRLAARYANFRKASIYGGSNEIQRNILAKATLGL